MKLRIKALRSLRWNYKWRGVWVWLKGRTCFTCGGKGKVLQVVIQVPRRTGGGNLDGLVTCSRCHGKPKRGYQRILSEPETVLNEQRAIAEGVMG